MQRTFRKCENCGAEVSLSNFARHRVSRSCANGGKKKTRPETNPWESWKIGEDIYQLPCGYKGTKKACRNKMNGLGVNGRSNLLEYIGKMKTGQAFAHNKGVPMALSQKEKIAESVKKFYRLHGTAGCSMEKRAKLSNKRKAYLATHPECHANARVAGNRSKMTYPETVAHDWFVKQGMLAKHNQRIGRYYPDFLVGQTIVEIDGPRWHSAPHQVERDQKRDAELTALGYVVHRIVATANIEEALARLFAELPCHT